MLNVFTGFSMDEDGHELMPHGTEDFPCVGYKEYHSDRPGGDFPWHWHNDFEVIICDSGGIRVKVPGASTLLGAGDACFINSGIMHYIIGEPEGTMRSIVAFPPLLFGSVDSVFATRYVMPVLRDGSIAMVTFRGDEPEERVAASCIDRAISVLEHEEFGYEFEVRGYLSRLLVEVLKREKSATPPPDSRLSTDAERIRKMCAYVESHLSEDVSVGDMARAAGIGERECLRCFKRTLDSTPSQYLLRRRMDLAAQLLTSGPCASVAEAAQRVGVGSPSHFSKLFRREYRCTPSEYRTRMLADAGRRAEPRGETPVVGAGE